MPPATFSENNANRYNCSSTHHTAYPILRTSPRANPEGRAEGDQGLAQLGARESIYSEDASCDRAKRKERRIAQQPEIQKSKERAW